MNQYLLSTYQGQAAGAPPTAEDMQSFMCLVIALEEEMDRTGAFAFGGALRATELLHTWASCQAMRIPARFLHRYWTTRPPNATRPAASGAKTT